MKMFDKLKNMFTEEVEVEEEPIKKAVIQVEIPAPEARREQRRENNIESMEEIKEEQKETKEEKEKFVFPVYFDDKDFDDLEKPAPKPVTPKKDVYGAKQVQVIKEEKKIFRPTPIISPVYGVLDKNYRKEDIVAKPKTAVASYHDSAMNIDDLRKKAYGTLEDDLETTLFSSNSMLFVDNEEEKKEVDDMFEDLEDTKVDIFDGDMTSFDLLSRDERRKVRESSLTEDNLVNEELNKKVEDDSSLNDSDLFDLIDSMYEKSDEE